MTLFTRYHISCNSQNKADAVYLCQVKYPVVGRNVSNLLLSVVLKRLLAAHLVIYSPSADFGGTVTRLSLSLGLSIHAVLELY